MAKEGKPVHSGMLTIVFNGSMPPDTFLESALLKYPTCFGMAAFKDGKINLYRLSQKEMVEGALKEVKELLEHYKDTDRLTFFGDYPDGEFTEDSIQPIPLVVSENDEPLMVMALQGDYSEGRDPHHSDAQKMVTEELMPMFFDAFNDSDKNMDKFKEHVSKNKTFNRAMSSYLKEGNAFAILMGADVVTVGDGMFHDQGDWGSTTNTLEDKPEPKKEEAPPPKAGEVMPDFSMLPAAVRRKKQEEWLKAHPNAAAPSKEETKPKASVPPTGGAKDDEFEMLAPPAGITKMDHLRRWYVGKCPNGIPPTNWKERPAIPVKKAKVIKDLKDLPIPKDVGAKHIPETKKEDMPGLSEKGVLTADRKAKLQEFLKKPGRTVALLDTNSEAIMDPAFLYTEEDKAETFTDNAGLPGLPATYHWHKKDLLELANDNVVAIIDYAFQCRSELIKLQRKTFQEKAKAPASGPTAEEIARMPAAMRRKHEQQRKAG